MSIPYILIAKTQQKTDIAWPNKEGGTMSVYISDESISISFARCGVKYEP